MCDLWHNDSRHVPVQADCEVMRDGQHIVRCISLMGLREEHCRKQDSKPQVVCISPDNRNLYIADVYLPTFNYSQVKYRPR